MTASKNWLNPAKLEYFDPHFDKSYPKRDIIAINKKIQICNVHLFIACIEDFVKIKSSVIVSTNINITLKKAAQAWYIAELSNLERSAFSDNKGNKTEC